MEMISSSYDEVAIGDATAPVKDDDAIISASKNTSSRRNDDLTTTESSTTANTMESAPQYVSIHSALNKIGYGPFQRRILLAAGLCSAADAMEILILSFLSVWVADDWNLSLAQQSSLISSVFAGAFGGTLVLGTLGDFWGRRPTFLLTAGIVAVGGLSSALCQAFWQLALCRTVVGMGIGGVTIPFDTYGEILPSDRRGKNLALPSYFWTTGTLLVVLGARVTTPNWRWLCVWCSVPCLIATVVAYFVVPESPQWLVSQGRSTMALHILRDAAVRNGVDPDEVLPMHTKLMLYDRPEQQEGTEEEITVPPDAKSSVYDFVARGRLGTSLSILAVWFGYALLYYGVVLAITAVFEDSGAFDYEAIFMASLSEIAATTLVICTIERWGRKFLHALSFGMGGVCIFGLCWWASSSSDSAEMRQWSILLAFFSRLCIFAGSCITWIWTAEVLETHLRTTGHSLANAGGRIGGFLSPYLVSPARFSYTTIGIILWIVSWSLVLIAWRNLPETLGAPMGMRGQEAAMEFASDEKTRGGRSRNGAVQLSITQSGKQKYQSVNEGAEQS